MFTFKLFNTEKHGVPTSECCNLYDHIRQHCQALDVVGIMTIGAFDHDLSKGPNPDFQVCKQLIKTINPPTLGTIFQ